MTALPPRAGPAGAVGEFLIGIPAGGVLCLVVAAGSGWYDYRVWTSRSRRLLW